MQHTMKASILISFNLLFLGSAFVSPSQQPAKAAGSQLEINDSQLNAERRIEGSRESSSFMELANRNVGRRTAIAGSTGIFLAPSVASLFPNAAAAPTLASVHEIPQWTLENDVQMPNLALNTVGLSTDEAEKAVRLAVAEGMTHIDFHPGKERDGVAQYLAKEGKGNAGTIKRESLFLNTKIRKAPPGTSAKDAAERARTQIEEDLSALGSENVDPLMLRDSPDCDIMQAQWAVLEEALTTGKTRSIGVINFCEMALACILQTAKVKPACQGQASFELLHVSGHAEAIPFILDPSHPRLGSSRYFSHVQNSLRLVHSRLHVGMGRDPLGLRSFCDSKGIRTFAYGALGEPGADPKLLSSPILKRIGKAHGDKTPGEVALCWVLQMGAAALVRPSTTFGQGMGACVDPDCGKGLRLRARSYSWSLWDQDMAELDAMTLPNGNPTLFSTSGCPNSFVMPK